MSEHDRQLDQILAVADQRFSPDGIDLNGADIRRLATRRQQLRSEKRKAIGTAIGVGILLAGWMLVFPDPERTETIVEVNEPTTEQLLADLEEVRKQQLRVDEQLRLLEFKKRLNSMAIKSLRLNQALQRPRKVAFRRDQNTWTSLEQVAVWKDGVVPELDRWKLELFAQGFPDTPAGTVARTMLLTNQVHESLYEKSNEL